MFLARLNHSLEPREVTRSNTQGPLVNRQNCHVWWVGAWGIASILDNAKSCLHSITPRPKVSMFFPARSTSAGYRSLLHHGRHSPRCIGSGGGVHFPLPAMRLVVGAGKGRGKGGRNPSPFTNGPRIPGSSQASLESDHFTPTASFFFPLTCLDQSRLMQDALPCGWFSRADSHNHPSHASIFNCRIENPPHGAVRTGPRNGREVQVTLASSLLQLRVLSHSVFPGDNVPDHSVHQCPDKSGQA